LNIMSIVDQTLMQLGRAQTEQQNQGVRRLPGFEDFPMPLKRKKAFPWRTGIIAASLLTLGGLGVVFYPQGDVPPALTPASTTGPAMPAADLAQASLPVAGEPPASVIASPEANKEIAAAGGEVIAEGQPSPALPEAVAIAAEPTPLATLARFWWQEGWSNLKARNADEALSTWARGFRALPDTQRIVVGYAYSLQDRHLAFRQAEVMPGGLVLREADVQPEQPRFRVVALPFDMTSNELSRQMAVLGQAPHETNVRYLKDRLYRAPAAGDPPRLVTSVDRSAKLPAEKTRLEPSVPALASVPAAPVATRQPPAEPTPAVGTAQKDLETSIAAARGVLRSGQYAQALSKAREITDDHPDHWEGWFILGSAELASGNLPAADQALARASRLNQRSAAVVTQRALIAQERRDHVQAVRLLEEARQLAPRLPEVHLNLGLSHEALGNAGAAEESYRNFLRVTESATGAGAYGTQRRFVMEKLGQQATR
jgi:Tfp pilus assembly protein PilF